ncbi:MAG: hypothetical protein RIC55_21790 [Pirellulaceae bacterium]
MLQVIDADDATMTVESGDCGDSYPVEPDAIGDGCMTDYLNLFIGSTDLFHRSSADNRHLRSHRMPGREPGS